MHYIICTTIIQLRTHDGSKTPTQVVYRTVHARSHLVPIDLLARSNVHALCTAESTPTRVIHVAYMLNPGLSLPINENKSVEKKLSHLMSINLKTNINKVRSLILFVTKYCDWKILEDHYKWMS